MCSQIFHAGVKNLTRQSILQQFPVDFGKIIK